MSVKLRLPVCSELTDAIVLICRLSIVGGLLSCIVRIVAIALGVAIGCPNVGAMGNCGGSCWRWSTVLEEDES